MTVHISSGNTKLGQIPNISLSPVWSCEPNIPCAKDCYAQNITKHYPHVAQQWNDNLTHYVMYPLDYFRRIYNYLIENKPTHFRWHVGGDIPNRLYLDHIVTVANALPRVNFMLFTKRYEWVTSKVYSRNLNVILSMWPYIEMPNSNFPKTWIRGDLRAPKDAFVCKGKCIDCLYCWDKPTNILLKPH